jgi:hypothetical protein
MSSTEDLSIALPPGRTVDEIVDAVLRAELRKLPFDVLIAQLVTLGLDQDDAMFAHDRVLGGVVRASTGDPQNAPPRDQDPIAWASYQRCLRDPSLVAALRPKKNS